jgi:hypothetical protein
MATRGRRLLLLGTHGLTLVRGKVLRWRLETYGLYMPSYPNQRPWWRVNSRALSLLLRHRGAYGDWLQEMRALRRAGASGWWRAQLGGRHRTLQAYIERVNGADVPAGDREGD